MDASEHPIRTALGRGVRKRCPHCGVGPLFSGWAHLASCSVCGLVFERNSGDTWALGLMAIAALGIVIIVTAPNRWGAGIALHYLSRVYWPDQADPIPPSRDRAPS